MAPRIRDLRAKGRIETASRGMNPRDVDLLLADAAGQDSLWVLAHDDESLDDESASEFEARLARRLGGEPLQYIRGHCGFYGRDFLVDRRVLIPRPETELLVEAALARVPSGARILDIGTGSGCIAATIALERSDCHVLATDLSLDALLVARGNAHRLGAEIELALGDGLEPVRGPVDLIVSNPPYVPASDLEGLQVEVRGHEPRVALTPEGDGLGVIRALILESPRRLQPDGALLMEIGFNQHDAVREMALDAGWRSIEIRDDLAAIPRVVVLEDPSAARKHV